MINLNYNQKQEYQIITEKEYIRLLKYSTRYLKLISRFYNNYISIIETFLTSHIRFNIYNYYIVENLYLFVINYFENLVFFNKYNSVFPKEDKNYKKVIIDNFEIFMNEFLSYIYKFAIKNKFKKKDFLIGKYPYYSNYFNTHNFILKFESDENRQNDENRNGIIEILFKKNLLQKLIEIYKEDFENRIKKVHIQPKENGDFYEHTEQIYEILKSWNELITFILMSIDLSLQRFKNENKFRLLIPVSFLNIENLNIFKQIIDLITKCCNYEIKQIEIKPIYKNSLKFLDEIKIIFKNKLEELIKNFKNEESNNVEIILI